MWIGPHVLAFVLYVDLEIQFTVALFFIEDNRTTRFASWKTSGISGYTKFTLPIQFPYKGLITPLGNAGAGRESDKNQNRGETKKKFSVRKRSHHHFECGESSGKPTNPALNSKFPPA